MPAQPIYHASIEGAQHGAKSLEDFLDYAKRSGAAGAQPSNYMLQGGKLFKSAKEIQDTFDRRGMTLDGISAHCQLGSIIRSAKPFRTTKFFTCAA